MGSYSSLRSGPFHIDTCKNDIEPSLMSLFTRSDRRTSPLTLEEWESADGDPESWDESFARLSYNCLCAHMRDRLNCLGSTYKAASEAFLLGCQQAIKKARKAISRVERALGRPPEFVSSHPDIADGYPERMNKDLDHYRFTIEAPDGLSVVNWIEALGETHRRGLLSARLWPAPEHEPLIRYIAIMHGLRCWFQGYDTRMLLRLAIEACDAPDDVVYDWTDLVVEGYVNSQEDMIAYAEHLLNREHEIFGKTIVLTEGATDKWILERSLRLLCPHLTDFYSFMNFEGVRMEGGAGALTTVVKAFAAAGISNRVVALYDNDTAGRSAMQALAQVTLPENIVVMQLPRSDLASFYPTQGPTGISPTDVNGLTVSIDLYLGMDVLQDGAGFAPVEWRGLDPRLRQYQGEVIGKNQIPERFRRKIATCEQNPDQISSYDWKDMRLVLTECERYYDAGRIREANMFTTSSPS